MKLTEDYSSIILAVFLVLVASAGIQAWFPSITWSGISDLTLSLRSFPWMTLVIVLAVYVVVLVAAQFLKGEKIFPIRFNGYLFIFLLAFVAHFITGNSTVKGLGLEVVIFSLLLGLLISNSVGTPEWIKAVLQTEFYIKIGLVLMGCSILFGDILNAGMMGLVQSIIVVLVVWQFCFWLGRKFKLDDEYRALLSSAVAICGVSAAIATAGVIKGDSKRLSNVVSLVLITAIPMLLFMPYLANVFGLNSAVAGAWLGGTIDTTGAVVAPGNLLGEEGLKYATLVKFSQNVLLGIAAFVISLYWTFTKKQETDKPSLKVIWDRFPKFVLGFIAASFVFSFLLSPEVAGSLKTPLKNIQSFWFALAFTSIGLETRFADVFNKDSKNPAFVFLIAQAFNIVFTLLVAWLLFN